MCKRAKQKLNINKNGFPSILTIAADGIQSNQFIHVSFPNDYVFLIILIIIINHQNTCSDYLCHLVKRKRKRKANSSNRNASCKDTISRYNHQINKTIFK